MQRFLANSSEETKELTDFVFILLATSRAFSDERVKPVHVEAFFFSIRWYILVFIELTFDTSRVHLETRSVLSRKSSKICLPVFLLINICIYFNICSGNPKTVRDYSDTRE